MAAAQAEATAAAAPATHAEEGCAERKLCILCIHGFRQNSKQFKVILYVIRALQEHTCCL
jgi:triacylglycerol esterase/lipase EstA (alpha/beta hydrolase family)